MLTKLESVHSIGRLGAALVGLLALSAACGQVEESGAGADEISSSKPTSEILQDDSTTSSLSFPLGQSFSDSECNVAGESSATIEFLDDSATLVACPEAGTQGFMALNGGTVVANVDGYTLISVPNLSSLGVDAEHRFELDLPTGAVSVTGTCLVEENMLSVSSGPDASMALSIYVDLGSSTGTLTYSTDETVVDAVVETMTLAAGTFALTASTAAGESLVASGACDVATPDSERFDVSLDDPMMYAAVIGSTDIDRSAIIDLNGDGNDDVIVVGNRERGVDEYPLNPSLAPAAKAADVTGADALAWRLY